MGEQHGGAKHAPASRTLGWGLGRALQRVLRAPQSDAAQPTAVFELVSMSTTRQGTWELTVVSRQRITRGQKSRPAVPPAKRKQLVHHSSDNSVAFVALVLIQYRLAQVRTNWPLSDGIGQVFRRNSQLSGGTGSTPAGRRERREVA